jgi:very-short-patch-repair endonuclease
MVSESLNVLGCKHEMEYVTQGGLVVDIAIPERKLAIEIDGPGHYTLNTQQPVGR